MVLGKEHGDRPIMFSKLENIDDNDVAISSKLRQWPIKLKLVPAYMPFFQNADLLITADCVPYAYSNYHNDFLKGRRIVIGCSKSDDAKIYIDKLRDIIRNNNLKSIAVLRMEVPCCSGIADAAKIARDEAKSDLTIDVVTISIDGQLIDNECL